MQGILAIVNWREFKSQPASQIVPALADLGIYIASKSSFDRVLREQNLQHRRGRSKNPVSKPLTTQCATEPNQVWMWDITWLPGPIKR